MVSSAGEQLRFAVEFATFLVAVAGSAVVLLRPGLFEVDLRTRLALATGLLLIAAAAFLHGSLLVERGDSPVVLGLRGAGIAALAVGTLVWRGRHGLRRWLLLGTVVFVAAEIAAPFSEAGANWLVLGGDLGMIAVLFTSSRRSIPARVATSAAATLMVVVLAVSLALSVVISSTIEREAVKRVDARSRTEVEAIDRARGDAIKSAKLTAGALQVRRDLLLKLSDHPGHDPVIEGDLSNLAGLLFSSGPVLYVADKGAVVASVGIDPAGATLIAGSPAVSSTLTSRVESGSVQVVGRRVLATGVWPVTVRASEGSRFVGVVVAAASLDENFLHLRALSDPELGLTLVGRDGVLAGFGRRSRSVADVRRVAGAALSRGGAASSISRDYFLAAQPVLGGDGSPVVAVVSSSPTSQVTRTRRSLFRVLFLVALGAGLLALVAAVLVGERIGAGLRRLTQAAEGIRRGDLTVRADVHSEDEVGVLGEAFDSMAGSIESQAGELRRAADDESRLRNRLEAVVAGMGEALVAIDAQGHVVTFNAAAEQLVGVPSGEAIGRPVTDVVQLRGPEGEDLSSRLSRPRRGSWSGAGTVERDDYTVVPVVVSAGALGGPGGDIAGAVWVLRDMRREREVERMKTEFLSNISHELRTPLTPIKGYAEMLRIRQLPRAKSKEFVEGILSSAERLERVVDLLVNFSAFEAGRLPLRLAPVKVREMVDDVVERWRKSSGGREIVRRVGRDVPEVTVDRRLLERSLDELLDNAIKYSPDGGRVSVAAEVSSDGEGRRVEISVTDKGVGIAEDLVDHVFEEFSQADSSSTRQFGGLGLGLAFVQRIVRAHDGELICKSEQGKGSTFSIVLPVAPKER